MSEVQNYLTAYQGAMDQGAMEEMKYRNWLALYGRGVPNMSGPMWPNMNMQVASEYLGSPRFSGSVSAPFLGGDIGLSGNYRHDPGLRDFGAMMNYLRRF